jgi:glycolate oxidase FAD binding subunit
MMADTPTTEAAIADAIRAAHDAREPLAIEGNATLAGALRPVQAARTLSTRGLSGITLHSPAELVIAAHAGTPMPVLQAALAQHNQHLVSEPPDLSALMGRPGPPTLGGVVAANLSGPRRVALGATRDQVIGVRAVNGLGEAFHSGGRVLKNVTGLDLCKLLTGSFGTLGVLTEITLKVLPRPETTGSLLLLGLDDTTAVEKLCAGMGTPFGVTGAAHLPAPAAATLGFPRAATLLRIEDFSASVAYRLDRLWAELGGEMLDDTASRAAWRAIRDVAPLAAAPDQVVWKVSVRPTDGPRVAAALQDFRYFLDWSGGLVWVAGPATVAAHRAVETAVRGVGGTWQVLRAPEALTATIDVIPPEAPPLAAIGARVKAAMDPRGILNPGRMRAGI